VDVCYLPVSREMALMEDNLRRPVVVVVESSQEMTLMEDNLLLSFSGSFCSDQCGKDHFCINLFAAFRCRWSVRYDEKSTAHGSKLQMLGLKIAVDLRGMHYLY
jgi:hypothetical protein